MPRFPHKPYSLEVINGTMYEILAEYPITKVLNASLVKQWIGADTAFKVNRNGVYIFCREVQDIEWEDVNEKTAI